MVKIQKDIVLCNGHNPVENTASTCLSLDMVYEIIVSNLFLEEENEIKEIYGIKISKFEKGTCVQSQVIEDISTDIRKVSSIIQMLADKLVSPIHLKDVLEDMFNK